MITEDYVSFETAKLLKEKGFDEKCICVYHDGKLQLVSSLGICCGEGYSEQILTYTNSECEWSPIMISAPTLQMAMKWLREVHNIAIETEWEHLWYAYIKPMTSKPSEEDYYQCKSSKYEEACEIAIKYCLENLM